MQVAPKAGPCRPSPMRIPQSGNATFAGEQHLARQAEFLAGKVTLLQ